MISRISPWLLLAGYPILLWWHLSSLLERPYYQFVVVVPILVLMLIRPRGERDELAKEDRWPWVAPAGLAIALALLAAATWKWSPWTAMLSFLIAGFCLLWTSTGGSGMCRWLSAWVMCWILLPLPFGWDERLTVALRGVTTRMTSHALDQFGVLHISYMNVIQVPAKSLFIADACSGVHSLYVLLAASLFWALYYRRAILHTFLLVSGAFAVVLFENITRLVVIVLGLGWRKDLSVGTNHLLLGLLLFMLSVGLIISWDQLLLFLLPGRNSESSDSIAARTAKVAGSAPPGEVPRRAGLAMIVLAPMFFVCGGMQWLLKPSGLPDLSASFRTPATLKELAEAGLPENLAGYNRLGYKHITRVVGDPFGQQSEQWLYGKEPILVQVSIDYPYAGHHDPRVCYSQVGWQIGSAEVRHVSVRQQAGDQSEMVNLVEAPVAVVQMSRPLEGEAILMFSLVDQGGRITALLADRSAVPKLDDARRRFQSFFAPRVTSTEAPPQAPLTQFQLLARSAEAMTPVQIEQLVMFYHEFRKHALDQFSQGSATSSPAVTSTSKWNSASLAPSTAQE